MAPLILPTCPRESTRVHKSPLGCGPVGCRWHKGFRPGVHESTDTPPPPPEKHSMRRRGTTAPRPQPAGSGRVARWRIIMAATLPQDVSNTYYGQWNGAICKQTPANRRFHCPQGRCRARGVRGRRGPPGAFPGKSRLDRRETYAGRKKKTLPLDLDAVVLDHLGPARGLELQLLEIGLRRAAGHEESEVAV